MRICSGACSLQRSGSIPKRGRWRCPRYRLDGGRGRPSAAWQRRWWSYDVSRIHRRGKWGADRRVLASLHINNIGSSVSAKALAAAMLFTQTSNSDQLARINGITQYTRWELCGDSCSSDYTRALLDTPCQLTAVVTQAAASTGSSPSSMWLPRDDIVGVFCVVMGSEVLQSIQRTQRTGAGY